MLYDMLEYIQQDLEETVLPVSHETFSPGPVTLPWDSLPPKSAQTCNIFGLRPANLAGIVTDVTQSHKLTHEQVPAVITLPTSRYTFGAPGHPQTRNLGLRKSCFWASQTRKIGLVPRGVSQGLSAHTQAVQIICQATFPMYSFLCALVPDSFVVNYIWYQQNNGYQGESSSTSIKLYHSILIVFGDGYRMLRSATRALGDSSGVLL
ncbi:hypothetical protein C8J56DRAFT_899672 [Mycena floridula]|nr:hypothetical protein C8J56DRAFT_899672 [Mycena floridula]